MIRPHPILPVFLALTFACSGIDRPSFSDGGQAAGTPLGGVAAEPSYATTVSVDITKGPDNGLPREVSPGIFGAAEELGKIGLNSDDEIKRWVINTSLNVIRWGGTAAEAFDWEADGYRGLIYTSGDGTRPEKPQMTLMEFLDLCEEAGAEPVITVGAQVNDPAKAARLVEFLNSPDTAAGPGAERARLGHHEPYGVALFQVGDDPWGALQKNHDMRCHFGKAFTDWTPCQLSDGDGGDASYVDSASYAATLSAYAAAMRAAPGGKDIRIIAAGFPYEVATIEAAAPGTVNYLHASYYPFTGAKDPLGWGSADNLLDAAAGIGENPCGCGNAEPFEDWYAGQMAPLAGTDVRLSVGEWNLDAGGTLLSMGSYPVGLWAADILGRMARSGVGIAALYSVESIDQYSPSPDRGDFGFMRYETATGRRIKKSLRGALQFYSIFYSGAYVESASSDARLITHAGWNEAAGSFTLVAVNRDRDRRAETSIAWAGGAAPGGFARGWSVEEDAPDKSTGTTGPRADRVFCTPDLARCSIPPFSVAVITGN